MIPVVKSDIHIFGKKDLNFYKEKLVGLHCINSNECRFIDTSVNEKSTSFHQIISFNITK